MSEKYHKYVFDKKNRKPVFEFEKMYQKESEEGFDSWYQENLKSLKKQICINILDMYNFDKVLDVGCGKGHFTNLLKKKNNEVTGIDVSKTAIEKAKACFPYINFKVLNAMAIDSFDKDFDLVVSFEILSYLEEWKKFIGKVSDISNFFLICLFIPDDPIGFVKSTEELIKIFSKYFDVIHDIRVIDDSSIILFGKTKN